MKGVPTEMKAAAVDRFGGPEVLHTETLRVPEELGPKEILLRVDTAGIGVWDPWVREGGFDDGKTQFPYVMGNDGAGEVVGVGSQVRRFKVGDRAWAYQMEGGFYAEYVKVREDHAAGIPPQLDPREAGALGADGITALRGLDDHLRVKKGQHLMIVGASGGIGHIAVQLAKRMGAKVLAVASGDDGVELVKRLGADAAIDGKREDIAKAAREFAPKGLDAALVLAGGEKIDEALEAMKRPGRIAHPIGVEPEPKAPEGVKRIGYDGTPTLDAFERLNRLISKEPFHVEVSHLYKLEEVSRAHQDVEKHHLGKLAIQIH
jgi:NADPH:quinone reductase-like Zn-dependent oxidoreductase